MTSKESNEKKDEEKDVVRSKIETLVLVTGLVMMPFVYLWQQSLTILDENIQVWSDYLNSTLGSQYTYKDVIASYFTPFALLRALPMDLWIWSYDIIFVLSVVVVVIFGIALAAIEEHDTRRVKKLVQRGTTYLNTVLMAIIFFGILHLLTTTLFPIKLLLGLDFTWIALGIALASTIIVWKVLSRSIKAMLGTDLSSFGMHQKKSEP